MGHCVVQHLGKIMLLGEVYYLQFDFLPNKRFLDHKLYVSEEMEICFGKGRKHC